MQIFWLNIYITHPFIQHPFIRHTSIIRLASQTWWLFRVDCSNFWIVIISQNYKSKSLSSGVPYSLVPCILIRNSDELQVRISIWEGENEGRWSNFVLNFYQIKYSVCIRIFSIQLFNFKCISWPFSLNLYTAVILIKDLDRRQKGTILSAPKKHFINNRHETNT